MIMCLYNAQIENLPESKVAWKVLAYRKSRWRTPMFNHEIVGNKLKAYGPPGFYRRCSIHSEVNMLSGGVIHCYRTRQQALTCSNNMNGEHTCVFEVIGKDCIAYNNEQIAFKEIEFVEDISGMGYENHQ